MTQTSSICQGSSAAINDLPCDWAAATRFLNALGGTHRAQIFGDAFDDPNPGHFNIGPDENSRFNLEWHNNTGCGIYIAVNETDGEGREAKNIVRIRAVFVDLDGASLEMLKRFGLTPHFIIETSPGHYHAYWFVVVGFPLDQFTPIQKRLARLTDGDPSVHDPSRVMRLPGLYHLKDPGNPHMVHFLEDNADTLPRYPFNEIVAALDKADGGAPLEDDERPGGDDGSALPERPIRGGNAPQPHEVAYAKAALDGCASDMAGVPDGQKWENLRRKGYRLGGMGWTGAYSRDDVVDALVNPIASRCRSVAKAEKTVRQAFEAGKSKRLEVRDRPPVMPHGIHAVGGGGDGADANPQGGSAGNSIGYQLTDLGNAERFRDQHRGRVIYVPSLGWLYWDGKRWVLDTTGEVNRLAHATVRSLFTAAAAETDHNRATELGKWAVRSQQRERLAAIPAIAQHLMGMDQSRFDADPMLLNLLNGTIDLRRGELRPHRREDFITKLAPVVYDPNATHETFDTVLATAIDNKDERKYLQKALGYSLTGRTDEEVLFFAYGIEATGKSTILESFKNHLGDYAVVADPETFLKAAGANPGGARGDVARLHGARFILTSELDDGRKLAEGLVKRLTGGDTITARRLYKDEFEFEMTGKIWLMANHRPKVDAADGGMWRRIRVVPFEHSVPKDERDPRVKALMKSECGPAMLTWAVKGCLAWQEEGLKTTDNDKVEKATKEYRDSQDFFSDFIEDRCTLGEGLEATAGELYSAYMEWAADNKHKYPFCKTAFAQKLEQQGCLPDKGAKGVRKWKGIALKPISA